MSNNTLEKQPPAKPVSSKPENPVVQVGKLISEYLHKGTLRLPADYSPENALKSAWLALQEIPNLQSATKESVVNSLLDMAVQGLNPAKKQCYFMLYGQKLTCQRSYFGDQALAERVRPGIEVYSAVVWKGDELEYEVLRGRTVVTKHKTKLENQGGEILAAYCGIVDTATGEDLGCDLMTFEQIKKSWEQSKTYGKGDTPHKKFPDQMALRTVIRRRCKPIINSSSDSLLMESVRRQDEDAIEAQAEEDARTHANGEVLSLPAESVAAIPEPEPEPAKAAEPVAPAPKPDDEYDPFKVD